jgi:predicted transcriptional regulator
MLACQASDAGRLVHADGIDPSRATLPVGTVCRLCPRRDCAYRQEEPLIDKRQAVDKSPMSRP